MSSNEDSTSGAAASVDPRAMLANWANQNDEWVRYLVNQVLISKCAVTAMDLEYAYELLRQAKAIDERILPTVPQIQVDDADEAIEEPLVITKISEIAGVNALVGGAVIEPHTGLTILFGENGTGKTGYARVLKAVADSRTADEVLGDIDSDVEVPKSAKIAYSLGSDAREFVWSGQRGQAPFARMSIFDNLSVSFHVDDELEYVYVPAVLALFNHVSAAIKAIQEKVAEVAAGLTSRSTTLLSRFPRDAEIYPLIQTLGASSDLSALKARASTDPKVDEKIDALRKAVAALEANTLAPRIAFNQRSERVLNQAVYVLNVLVEFNSDAFNENLAKRANLQTDHQAFRETLFAAAALPADPEETWEGFVSSGEAYRAHLDEMGVHDASRCLYCRQALGVAAAELVGKYAEYLADKISQDIAAVNVKLDTAAHPVMTVDHGEISALLVEYAERDDKPTFYDQLTQVVNMVSSLHSAVGKGKPISADLLAGTSAIRTELELILASTVAEITALQDQVANRATALVDEQKKLRDLEASAELAKSWTEISTQVGNANEADRLYTLNRKLSNLSRAITDLSKIASSQLINNNFEKLFLEECTALRAPSLKVEFFGRQGRVQRRKVLTTQCKPSKVLSEGEQKMLAMADFLAEARLSSITAPIIFDDPVSSLDHRRINEVAQRIALLAEENQVIVFTHDIFFATNLLSLFEKSKRCTYYQITDDEGKGKVIRATGPRWDTLSGLKKNINETIQAAKGVDGEARAALVRTGYDWIRSWCEVFTETELLKGVTQRYQPNVRMTVLADIKVGALPDAIEIVTRIFDISCRYIDGHSQPLPTLGVSPTLSELEAHWQELLGCKKAFDAAS